jgi:rubredoxin
MEIAMIERQIKITADDLMSYFAEKKADMLCPVCKNTQWNTFESLEDGDTLAIPLTGYRAPVKFDHMIPAYPIVCSTCGYLWLTLRKPLENWIAARNGTHEA